MKGIVEAIQSSGYKAALALSGGGSGALHALLAHPGASRFVLEVQIPYSPEAMRRFLGAVPEQACSEETARNMASRALSPYICEADNHILGVSCTAALQTIRERKGADRAFVCIKSLVKEKVYALEFPRSSRTEQESALSAMLLNLIAENTAVDSRLEVFEEICRIR